MTCNFELINYPVKYAHFDSLKTDAIYISQTTPPPRARRSNEVGRHQLRIRGANPAMPPNRSWQWSLAPLGGRKSNDSIVNLSKCKDFAPVSMSATDLAPLRKNNTLKH